MAETSDGDAIRAALRYRLDRFRREELGEEVEDEPEQQRQVTDADRALAAEIAVQQAMRRGDFENLPGAGKPLPGIGGDRPHDPDWWMRRKIEREQLRGLGPAALTLRTEDAELDARLDELTRADDVRAALEDFNGRVLEARRQLLGGPPVITQPRDVDAELAAWAERRAARLAPPTPEPEPASPRRRRRIRRRR
ncbi:DUF1992 domain-containing protein [Protaetiibacter sp. SSC-01]|uniref:DnaJ family domain-containing protein n=1 Tax=Protaetiibacter sp. SSC-01 TaxID=2759943 RepID=UPI0016575C1A|nr:DUF1992 domain-containing protein [Protaetiibacter sp. SSC-01]QNO37393.1 DUF1992 domain-containing protein [Protaetiibacter sp. SSC-01]